ncbi:MAG: DUF5615 family PIN-like protein [Pyrinomonadaceae bacterium]|nr:DUF5615 family PIN-like protein [Pyrinomonadaceae bacterium]
MKVAFQADADFNGNILKGIRRIAPEIDFKSADETGFQGMDDLTVLRIAAEQDRVLVSHDRKTMPIHFGEFLIDNNCPGVIIVSKKLSIGDAIHRLIALWRDLDPDRLANSIQIIDK